MFRDAELGMLIRLVRAEIDDQEKTNCERYISEAAAASFARQMSRLRTVERKLQRQRQALRGGRAAAGELRVSGRDAAVAFTRGDREDCGA
jgi:hypothetical protein